MGANPMISDSLTQTIGAAAIAGVVVLTGTNSLVVAGNLTAQGYYYPLPTQPGRWVPAVATKTTMPTLERDAAGVRSVRSDSRWDKYVFQRMEDLRAAKYDFTGLKVPTWHVIDRAWGVATTLFEPDTPTPSVVPTEDGNVLLVWHKAEWDIKIEVGSEEIWTWAHDRHAGTRFSGPLGEQQVRLSGLLAYLARQR
jgi:hypothetical protein